MILPAELKTALEEGLKRRIQNVEALGGGCIHRAARLDTPQGPLFCKWNQLNQMANFEAEAHGLAQLGASATLRTPQVLARLQTPHYAVLVLEFLPSGDESPEFWENLGFGLAELHRHSRPAFGLEVDNFIGSLVQHNDWNEDFHRFWAERRLLPLLEQVWPQLGSEDRQRANRLLECLPERIPFEAPALLHGDLWRGNLMATPGGEPCLIDPAVYYGHREAELAFTRLFGGFAPAFYACYQDAFPLAEGWRERVELFNLYPLLAHLVMFGPSYVRQVKAILKRFG